MLEERPEQLEQPRELKLCLGFDAERAHHGHALGLLDGVLEQRRLADPGLSADDECVAAPAPGALEQLVDEGALVLAADEQDPSEARPPARGTATAISRDHHRHEVGAVLRPGLSQRFPSVRVQ